MQHTTRSQGENVSLVILSLVLNSRIQHTPISTKWHPDAHSFIAKESHVSVLHSQKHSGLMSISPSSDYGGSRQLGPHTYLVLSVGSKRASTALPRIASLGADSFRNSSIAHHISDSHHPPPTIPSVADTLQCLTRDSNDQAWSRCSYPDRQQKPRRSRAGRTLS